MNLAVVFKDFIYVWAIIGKAHIYGHLGAVFNYTRTLEGI